MAQFYYTSLLTLKPRPGTKYATTYIKQTPEERLRFRTWLIGVAEDILGIVRIDPVLAEWFVTPLVDFRRSRRGEYYSAEDLVTDMLAQLAGNRDLPQAMLARWNRLCQGTPWQCDFVAATRASKQPHAGLQATPVSYWA